MGGVKINLWENEKIKCEILINDAWERENSVGIYSMIDDISIYNTKLGRYNASGRYAIVGDGNKIYLYWGTKLLNSIDYTENVSYDKITIQFFKHDNNHEISPLYIESLYIGEPLYYKSIIQQKAE